jgi:hypothetical protein
MAVSALLKEYFLDYESHSPTMTPVSEKLVMLERHLKKNRPKQKPVVTSSTVIIDNSTKTTNNNNQPPNAAFVATSAIVPQHTRMPSKPLNQVSMRL